MDRTDRLFLDTLRDLQERIESDDPYTILHSAALIRKLLLDASPLVDQVNRKYRLKIRYEIGVLGLPKGMPEPDIYSEQDGIDPDTSPFPGRRSIVTKDELLSSVLAKAAERIYSLKDIIDFEAHVMGAVHAGSPQDDKERVLDQIGQHWALGGLRPSLRQLRAIGRGVVKGLEPLRQKVEASADS